MPTTDMPVEDQAPDDQGGDDQGPNDMADANPDASQDMNNDSWSVFAHPCAGNRTDALWCDDAQTCWVGCGTTTTGTGLYVTFDAGAN